MKSGLSTVAQAMPIMRRIQIGVVVGALAVVTGCSASPEAGTASSPAQVTAPIASSTAPSSSESTTISAEASTETPSTSSMQTTASSHQSSGLQTYDSVQAIADDLQSADIDCDDLVLDDAPSIAVQQGRCEFQGDEIVMAVYTSPSERDEAVNTIADSLASFGFEYGVLAGGNWMVNCGSEDVCLTFRESLGGKLRSGEDE